MDIYSIINTIVTIFLGGGWFIYYKANKKKANGEAAQAEASGWEAQQKVYQHTIEDLENSCNFIRADRDLLRKENEELRKENMELRKEVAELRKTVNELGDKVARQGRRIEAVINKEKKRKKEEQ